MIIVQAKRCLKSLVWGLSDHSSRIAPQSKFGQFWVMKYLPAQFSLKPLDMHKCLFYGKSTGFLPGDCQKNFIGLGPFKHIENAFCITIEAKLLHKLWLGCDPRGMIVQTLELTYLTPLGMHYNQTHPPLNPFYLMRPNVQLLTVKRGTVWNAIACSCLLRGLNLKVYFTGSKQV